MLIFIPVIMQVQKDKRIPPMFLHRLFSWLRRKRRGSTLPQDEPGIVISTRMKELVPIESANTVETPFTDPANEDDEIGENREKFGT